MKKSFAILASILFGSLFTMAVVSAEGAPKAAFMGVKKCVMCHKGASKGNIYEKWMETKHAKAFETLGGEKAAAVMTKLGKSGSAQEAAECLACHVTNSAAKEEGVSCESCHGAGANYGKMNVMKDRAASVAAGMTDKPKDHCVSCHNDKSPTFKEFKFEEKWAKIAHPRKAADK